MQEVGVSQAILNRSHRKMLVADHSKFQRTAPARIASLGDIDVFFTDHPVSRDLADQCEAWATQVVVERSEG